MVITRRPRFLFLAVMVFFVCAVPPVGNAESDWRKPLHVGVTGDGAMFVDDRRVDTLLVHRGQIVYWEKRDPAGPDLTVQFERSLFHKRYRVRVTITEDGRPRFVRVNPLARMRVYFGNPEKGFDAGGAAPNSMQIRVVPPPGRDRDR
jgi:hypothetical protein